MDNINNNSINQIASDIIKATESTVIMNLRFMQVAIANLSWTANEGSAKIMSNGVRVLYDPALLIRRFKKNPNLVIRIYLHVLLHFIFHHNFDYDKKISELWDLACDIAVENTIIEMGLSQTAIEEDPEIKIKLDILKERAGGLHAAAIYRLFRTEEPSIRETEDLIRLFKRDEHSLWVPEESLTISYEQWKKISQRIKTDLKSFSKGKTDSESLNAALEEATREKVDYKTFLSRFMAVSEQIHINDDEFDYIYYMYGLEKYDNMPLIEPLEYADENKIKDLVIAIDTSASCKGEIVKEFLKRTVQIVSDSECFFTKYNVHILQCDSEVRSDTVITEKNDIDNYIKDLKIEGFGSTDFRPVFDYVEDLINEKKVSDLKGLIYFTDGYGIYPEWMPKYDTAFVFLSDDGTSPTVPEWAIKIVLEEEDILK